MRKKQCEYNSYGESLNSTSDFYSLKKRFEEGELIHSLKESLKKDLSLLNDSENVGNFDVTKIKESIETYSDKKTKNNERSNQPN
jgi:hypothetical protein